MQSQYVEFTGPGVVELKTREISLDNLAPLEVVVKNEATLISPGTELSRLHAWENVSYPERPGYAAVGRVVAKGEAVNDFAVGDRVLYAGKHASAQRLTHGQNYHWDRLYPVPPDMPAEDAVFAWLAQISLAACTVAQLDINDTVAVFGLGLIGNLAAQLFGIMGARVIALDPVAERCELARLVGLETVSNVPPREQVEIVLQRSNGRGAHVTVDAAGHSASIINCVEATVLHGQVVLLGTPRLPHECNITTMLRSVHEKGLVMRGAHSWRFPAEELRDVKQTVPWAFATMFDLIARNKLKVAPLRSHIARPHDASQMYHGLHHDREHFWGVVFDWT
jgi:2-desacetyl-2-hydroxyethyl bacteriochlorophyllide A dehydrogenase